MFNPFIADLVDYSSGKIVTIEDPDYDQLIKLGYSEEKAKEITNYVSDYYHQLYFYELIWRNSELLKTDFYFLPDVKISKSEHQQLLDYRQQLRDYPRQNSIPYRRPIQPDWFNQQSDMSYLPAG